MYACIHGRVLDSACEVLAFVKRASWQMTGIDYHICASMSMQM